MHVQRVACLVDTRLSGVYHTNIMTRITKNGPSAMRQCIYFLISSSLQRVSVLISRFNVERLLVGVETKEGFLTNTEESSIGEVTCWIQLH